MTTINTSSQILTIVSKDVQTNLTLPGKRSEFAEKDSDMSVTVEEPVVWPTLKERNDAMKLSQDMFTSLDYHANKFLKEIADEAPWILSKEFDFVNTGDEIEVIDHNLDESEYNYLKAKLNDDRELVRVTEWYNEALAEKWNNMSDSQKYTKEDAAGRIRILSVLKGTEEAVIEHSKSSTADNKVSVSPELYRYNHNDNARWGFSWGVILSSTSMPVKTTA